MKSFAFKDCISGDDIKSLRQRHNLTRKQLSDFLDVSVRTLEGWENSNKPINGPIVSLFRLLDEYPEYIEYYKLPESLYPLRLLYMEKGNINTVIDVDVVKRKVRIKNYTNNLIARAFGSKDSVSYEEYERFLESRCFPRTRDKMKIQQELLDIPFYDPLMIIEKTKGRMADDDYYIEIVRGNSND